MKRTAENLEKVINALVQDINAIMRASMDEVIIKCPNCGTDWNMTMYSACGSCGRVDGRDMNETLED